MLDEPRRRVTLRWPVAARGRQAVCELGGKLGGGRSGQREGSFLKGQGYSSHQASSGAWSAIWSDVGSGVAVVARPARRKRVAYSSGVST